MAKCNQLTPLQACSLQDRGLGLKSTQDQFYAVFFLVLRGKVLVLILHSKPTF